MQNPHGASEKPAFVPWRGVPYMAPTDAVSPEAEAGARRKKEETMAQFVFVADNTIPGLAAVDFVRRAADAIQEFAGASKGSRRSLRTLDRHLLQDLGLDRNAC